MHQTHTWFGRMIQGEATFYDALTILRLLVAR